MMNIFLTKGDKKVDTYRSGRGFMFVRNPFAAPGGASWRSTADYWFHSGFNRGEIGPSIY